MKHFPPKDTLHLLLPPANHALSCTRCHHVSFRRGGYLCSASFSQTENILTLFPKVNVSIEPARQLEIAVL